MQKIFKFITKFKWRLVSVLVFAGLLTAYNLTKTDEAGADTAFYAIEKVETGEVTSGITTSGKVVAAQKLDLDIYRRQSRIDVVNINNGSQVKTGDVLISFDKNDAYVDTQASSVSVAEAELALATARKNATDPNATIANLENQILSYEKTIRDAEKDRNDAYVDFLNKDLEVVPSQSQYQTLINRTSPTLSGRYESSQTGTYSVSLFASAADSGFSYRVTGLENYTAPVIFGKAITLGNRGLKITFPNDTKQSDEWMIVIPNNQIAAYQKNLSDYNQDLADLNKSVRDAEVALANARVELASLKQTDSSAHRDLNVAKANATLQEARQRLSQNYDTVLERDIVAPFSGTVEGMENVVVGATPKGGEGETIKLGKLISDDFLTTFSLGASDVARVKVGQRVKVTITSFSDQPIFEATITEISSLPESSDVAQYEVRALLNYDRTNSTHTIREGMLTDIEIVEDEKLDAIRIPTSAITYVQGEPTVTVLPNITAEQQTEIDNMGVIKTTGTPLATYTKTIELGVTGQYYTEVISGLNLGDLLVVSSQSEVSNESVVDEFGNGPGPRRDEEVSE